MPDKLFLEPGTYQLINDFTQTALTLSANNHRTISGADLDPNGSLYQAWSVIATESPDQFLVQSMVNAPGGKPLYVVFDKALKDGAGVVTGLFPMRWEVGVALKGIVLSFPMTRYKLRLSQKHEPVQLKETDGQDFLDYCSPDTYEEDAADFWGTYHWKCVPFPPEGPGESPRR